MKRFLWLGAGPILSLAELRIPQTLGCGRRTTALRTLAITLLYVGLFSLLSIPSVAAEGNGPIDDVDDVLKEAVSEDIKDLQIPVAGPKSRQKYPRLDSTLSGLVAGYERGLAAPEDVASQAPVHDNSSVAVTIYISANVSAIRSFLESNGADVRNVGEDYIEAYVPVTLLGQLSEQSGVIRVETIFGPKPVGPLTLTPARPPLQPLAQTNTDPCVTDLGALTGEVEETYTGSWSSSCTSDRRGERRARYYSFTLSQSSSVTLILRSSDADAYLYLLSGGRDGTVVRSDNDALPVTSNALIEAGLEPGTYTVEATTNARGERGSFELLAFSSPLTVCETSLGTLSAGSTINRSSQTWVDTCDSANRTGRYARYYSFTLTQPMTVTIDLTTPDSDNNNKPDTDTVLYLLPDDWTGDSITANDDKDDDTTNSQIRIGLTPGDYTVEATTFGRGVTGDFALAIASTTVSSPVESHGATTWHQAGLKGQDVKVGVIDLGFDGFGALMGTELPATVHMRCYTDIGEFSPNVLDCEVDTAHGTAVAETIIDIAPDVALYIANPFSRADLRAATEWMISQGVQVINYSAGWIWDGPGDGTSPSSISPLNTVDAAVAGGILWVNAAGNEAENTYFEQPYNDDNRANGLVEFLKDDGTRAAFNVVRLFAFYPLLAQLRWDDSWGGASHDLDLYLYDINGNLVASSTEFQSGEPEHIPFELLYYVPRRSGLYVLEISNGDIANLGWFQLQDFVGVADMDPVTLYGSIGNPADSANQGLLAAGAAPWGINSEIESFSSRGPTTDGRTKPDLVGADRGDTVAYGSAGFPGTSQASPHVAGLAALVLQQFPAYTPVEVARYLKDNAAQRTEPSPDNRDPNNIWGHGFARIPTVPRTPGGPAIAAVTPDDQALTVTWVAPPYTGRSTITAYDVRYRETGTTDWARQDNAWRTRGGALEYTISGLTANTEYDVQVRAVNSNGDGAWSRITLHSTLTATATATIPLRATTTDTIVLSTTTPDTLQVGPDDQLTFAPTTATEAGLTVKKAAAKLEITTDAPTTVSKTTATTTLEFGPDDPLTIALPRRGEAATLTFFTVDGTNVERVVTHALKQIPLPPPPSPPSPPPQRSTTSSSSSSEKRDRTPAPVPTPEPLFSASNSTATVNERKDGPGQSSLVFQRHDRPEASFDLPIGWISRDGTQQIPLGFVRDESLGQTYTILRRESDGQIVRWWIAGDSPWVYSIPWAEVNSRYTVPLAVLALIPLDDQYPQPNQLVRRFDGGDGRIVAYDAGLKQWRHIPDLATFQALRFYWCDVTAADGAFFERITLGPPYPASSTPARSDYPSCRT